MKHLFTEHPASVNETYLQHLRSAWSFAWQMVLGALNCFIHGLVPFLFEKSGSGRIAHLHDRMIIHRSRPPTVREPDFPPYTVDRSAGATDFHHSSS
jgi:hypothetical protein